MSRSARRGPWLPDEDSVLLHLVQTQGPNNWVRISQQLQHRSPKQCRERYHQNLKPSLKHEPISAQEGEIIEQMVGEMGKRWAEIARHLGDRSDNAVKNWWNGSMNRRRRNPIHASSAFKRMGGRIHPVACTRFDQPTKNPSTCAPLYPSHSFPSVPISQFSTLPPLPAYHNAGPSQHRPHHSEPASYNSQAEHQSRLPTATHGDVRDFKKSIGSTRVDKPEQVFHKPALSRSQTFEQTAEPAPLRLGTFLNARERKGSMTDLPLHSPAASEASQSMRNPPSLVSDNLSSCSVSPKMATSPLCVLGGSETTKSRYRGGTTAISQPFSYDADELIKQRFQPMETNSHHAYDNLTPMSKGKDNRMQLSSLLG